MKETKSSYLDSVPEGVLIWMEETHKTSPEHDPMFGILCESKRNMEPYTYEQD